MSIDTPNTPPNDQTSSASAASDLQDRAKQDLAQATDKARSELDAVSQRAAEDVAELKEKAREQVEGVTEKAKSFAGDQKTLAAEQISGVATAIEKVADELTDQPTIARYARDLASGLSSFGRTVEERDVDDLMGMAQDFGRKQPLAFLGAAALAGFVASRFAMASAHRRDQATDAGLSTQSTSANRTASSSYGYGSSPGSATPYASGEAQMGGA